MSATKISTGNDDPISLLRRMRSLVTPYSDDQFMSETDPTSFSCNSLMLRHNSVLSAVDTYLERIDKSKVRVITDAQ